MRSCRRPCPRPASFHQPADSIRSTFSLTGGCPYPTTSSWLFHDRLFPIETHAGKTQNFPFFLIPFFETRLVVQGFSFFF